MDSKSKLHLPVEQSDGTSFIKEIVVDSTDFNIDEADIEGELCRAGALLCYYADMAAELDAKSANAKRSFEEIQALMAIIYRGSGKVTQGMVDDHLATNQTVQQKHIELIECQKEAMKATNLFRAMNQRVECLKALAYRVGRQDKNAF